MKKELRQDSDLKMRILSREFMDHPVIVGDMISSNLIHVEKIKAKVTFVQSTITLAFKKLW